MRHGTYGSAATGVSPILADSGGNRAAAETNGPKWSSGTYRLEVGVSNFGDLNYNSGPAFDGDGLVTAALPEPAAWHMTLAGLAAFGLIGLRRRRSSDAPA